MEEVCAERSQDIARRRLQRQPAISGVVLGAGIVRMAITASEIAALYHPFRLRASGASAPITLFILIIQAPLVWGQGVFGAARVVGGALGLRQSLAGL
ncbi:MAG: hypothetical protein A2Y93_13765 [Chloroflexi bacterium RBG_13_68_17]|nr:MAG: hypothetical protein A2Y93_13765 [Chloroflexi bacterium RBG_13_68_17]